MTSSLSTNARPLSPVALAAAFITLMSCSSACSSVDGPSSALDADAALDGLVEATSRDSSPSDSSNTARDANQDSLAAFDSPTSADATHDANAINDSSISADASMGADAPHDVTTSKDSSSDTSSGADASSPTGTWLSGGSGNGAADGSFASWRGRANEIAGTWCDNSMDDQINLWSLNSCCEFHNFTAPIDIAVGAIYKANGETWAKAAAGDYDARWKQSLNTLKGYRKDKGTTYVRFAHEFNGDWWPHRWRVDGWEVSDFVKAWRRFRALQKSVFPEAQLVWCVNDDTSAANKLKVTDAWPGDEYVDVVGVDSYNWWPWVNTEKDFDEKLNTYMSDGSPRGLDTWRRFAEQHGKPMAIAEWASLGYDKDGAKGGDAPDFMKALHGWLTKHGGNAKGQIAYEIIFNQWDQFQVFPKTAQPKAAEAYKTTW